MYVHPIPLQHIVLTIISSASKLQNFQSSGRDKFAPLHGPLTPFIIPAWCAALQAVDRSPSLLIEVSKLSKHFGHYVFPDPGLFVTPASDEKKARCIESWLRARNAWFLRVGDEPSLAMSAQNWRDLLAIDISGAQRMGDTKAAKRRQQLLDMLLPSSTFPEVKIRSSSGEPLVWQGKRYLPGMLPPENIVREILWELYELNFTYELLSLDARACINVDAMQRIERQALISKCFPRPVHANSLLTLLFLQTPPELPSYLRLRLIVSLWTGKPNVRRHFSGVKFPSNSNARVGSHINML